MSEETRKKFNELMARVGTVQEGICPKHGPVKMTIIHNKVDHSWSYDEHYFIGVCEEGHEWQISRFTADEIRD